MKLKQQADLAAFLEAVGQCRGRRPFQHSRGRFTAICSRFCRSMCLRRSQANRSYGVSGEIVCDAAADLLRLHDFLE